MVHKRQRRQQQQQRQLQRETQVERHQQLEELRLKQIEYAEIKREDDLRIIIGGLLDDEWFPIVETSENGEIRISDGFPFQSRKKLEEKRQLNSELRKSDENNNPEMEGLKFKRDKYDFDYYDTAKTRMDDLRGISEQTELYQELARLEDEEDNLVWNYKTIAREKYSAELKANQGDLDWATWSKLQKDRRFDVKLLNKKYGILLKKKECIETKIYRDIVKYDSDSALRKKSYGRKKRSTARRLYGRAAALIERRCFEDDSSTDSDSDSSSKWETEEGDLTPEEILRIEQGSSKFEEVIKTEKFVSGVDGFFVMATAMVLVKAVILGGEDIIDTTDAAYYMLALLLAWLSFGKQIASKVMK